MTPERAAARWRQVTICLFGACFGPRVRLGPWLARTLLVRANMRQVYSACRFLPPWVAFAIGGLICGCGAAANPVGGSGGDGGGDALWGMTDAAPPGDLTPSPGDLLAPLPTPALAFSIKGRLNDQAAATQPETLLQGAGYFEARLGGEPLVLDDEPRLYRYADAAGRQSLVIEATRTEPDGSHARWRRRLARVTLSVADLGRLIDGGRAELAGSAASSASLHGRQTTRACRASTSRVHRLTGRFSGVHHWPDLGVHRG